MKTEARNEALLAKLSQAGQVESQNWQNLQISWMKGRNVW